VTEHDGRKEVVVPPVVYCAGRGAYHALRTACRHPPLFFSGERGGLLAGLRTSMAALIKAGADVNLRVQVRPFLAVLAK
jgi:hypothetical protein